MSHSDSMFVFEIVVEELKSFIDCKEFYIRSQFADVFTLNLKDPNELADILPKLKRKHKKKKATVRHAQTPDKKNIPEKKIQSGQSILVACNINMLISNMRRFPIELALWDKDNIDNQLGSTHIPWSHVYTEYLNQILTEQVSAPAVVCGEYSVFDEYSSKRMAAIRLTIKLTYFKDKISTSFQSLSEDNQKSIMYTGINSKATTTILTTVKDSPINMEEPGIIKTIYSGAKRNLKTSSKSKAKPSKKATKNNVSNNVLKDNETKKEFKTGRSDVEEPMINLINIPERKGTVNQSLVRSDMDLDKSRQVEIIKTKSCTSVSQEQLNILNYIFGDSEGPFGNEVYCVGYFTVENNFSKSPGSSSKVSGNVESEVSDNLSPKPIGRYKFKLCDERCPSRKSGSCSESVCSLDLPDEAADLITVTNCKQVECNNKKHTVLSESADERCLLDLTNLTQECCVDVSGGVKAKMKFNEDDCFCSCECNFGFMKKTTYCSVCGGFEKQGEDFTQKQANIPFPCPIYHKLMDKNKLKSRSTSGSESKKKQDGAKSIGSKSDKNAESERDSKKGKKKKKDDRFKFNYGYTAPQIGHSQCAMPCTGTLGAVPKKMGWLWTAEDVPGIKFRPTWKPGATNKHVVRLLRMAKNPGEVIAKKKRKDAGKKKSLKRPLLVVHKKEGEYTVTMETMKSYQKPRMVNQSPYEDKPVVTYTIGRTDEENRERRKKKERKQRRLEKEQRNFIQSAFQDMCNDICLKTYQQALGILPDTEDPECTCYPAHPGPDKTNLDVSCSCSEDKISISSDTDSDEWIVEFTPPNATFDPTFKGKKVLKTENFCQYTYLDYRVKLSDRCGNPVPRFFKGPDGKKQCSDLGGFWSAEKKWLEINIDGYIAPDSRWAPMIFIGPSGEQIDCDTGKFQTATGKWLVVGIDGYVDCNGRWKSYPKPKGAELHKKQGGTSTGVRGGGDKKDDKVQYKPSEASWSCFGDASPKDLSKMGIVGHGHDKKILLATLADMLAHGKDVKLPQPSTVPKLPPPKNGKRRPPLSPEAIEKLLRERTKCHHPVPSDKGIVTVDEHGHKAYFKMTNPKNKRPKERKDYLLSQGISLSSFHSPCLHSFINTEMLKRQQYEKIMGPDHKCVSTQVK